MTTKKAESKKAPETVEQKTPATSAKSSRRKAKAPEAPEDQEEKKAPAKAKAKKAPKIEEPKPPTHEELFDQASVSPTEEQKARIVAICGEGNVPFISMVPGKGSNVRGSGRDEISIKDYSDDQLHNYQSIQNNGIRTPFEVLISTRPEHVSLLSEGARNELTEAYGFAFAALIFSGNFRYGAVKLAIENGGYQGQENPTHVTLPYTTFEDTPTNRVSFAYDSNLVDSMSTAARANFVARMAEAIAREQGYKDESGKLDTSKVSNADLTRATGIGAALMGRYRYLADLGSTYGAMLTNENGEGFLTEASVISMKQEYSRRMGKEAKPSEVESALKKGMNTLARFVQEMTVEEKTLLKSRKNNALSEVEIFGILFPEKLDATKRKTATKRFPEIARFFPEPSAEESGKSGEGEGNGESGNGESGAASGGGLSGLKGKEESGTTARKVRPSSQQWNVFLNFLNEQGAITADQVAVMKFGFQKITNHEPVEGVLAEVVLHPEMSKVLGDITETELESAKAGYVLPVNDNDIKTLKGWNPEIFG